jgi:hypothetical protein
MAETYKKYKNLPVTGLDLSKIKKFLNSNLPFKALLQPGLLPKGATVPDMVQQCTAAIEELLSKYEKYKELGYVKDELQLMALGQLTNNSKTIENYLIARSWKAMPEADKAKRLTKSKFMSLLNEWFTYHKDRIGWESVSRKPIIMPDPNDPKNPKKTIKYYLSDNYHKPINQCFYPYDLRNHRDLGKINLSVSQSELKLLGMVDRFTNENDMVYFSPDNKDEYNAYVVISTLSNFPTTKSKTFAGVKTEFKKSINEIVNARERGKRRKREEMEEIKTEADAERETQKRNQEIAEIRAQEAKNKELLNKIEYEIAKEEDYLDNINKIRNTR